MKNRLLIPFDKIALFFSRYFNTPSPAWEPPMSPFLGASIEKRKAAICAVLLQEWLLELAALAQEHTVHSHAMNFSSLTLASDSWRRNCLQSYKVCENFKYFPFCFLEFRKWALLKRYSFKSFFLIGISLLKRLSECQSIRRNSIIKCLFSAFWVMLFIYLNSAVYEKSLRLSLRIFL